jgi:hypothetical protein
MSISADDPDTSIEIDALRGELIFVCRRNGCKKPNIMKFGMAKGEKAVSSQPMPPIGIVR